jgi:UDP-3-O-[3-hydroxymyristoyl] glucosamine N-acyltransferase
VDSLANVHSSAIVEVGAVVHAHAHVGPNTHILSGCIVGPNVNVGSSTTLGYNVVLQNCSVGNSCILHSGVCVGQDGFGFMVNDAGAVVKKPQVKRSIHFFVAAEITASDFP